MFQVNSTFRASSSVIEMLAVFPCISHEYPKMLFQNMLLQSASKKPVPTALLKIISPKK